MKSLIPSRDDQIKATGELLNFVERVNTGSNRNLAQALDTLQANPQFDNPHG